ncbi:MAG: transcriptional regulator [Candidatus Thorarchaeota archaeon]|nr:transcriptional regulator [Candidatus Thorarchaeota archaeon]
MTRSKEAVERCPVYMASRILGKKWSILILQSLMKTREGRDLRFSQIQRDLDWVSPKVLTQRLRELESEDIIHRSVDSSTIPAKVSYSLTEKGEALRDILILMQEWGIEYGDESAKSCMGQGKGFTHCHSCIEANS